MTSDDQVPPAAGEIPVSRGDPPPPVGPDIKTWAIYAKDRFTWADARINESRASARQLVAAVGIIIGLEGTILVRLALDEHLRVDMEMRAWAFAALSAALLSQFGVLVRLLLLGYSTARLIGPESPRIFATAIIARGQVLSESETSREVGAYYANAYDTFFALGTRLSRALARTTIVLLLTLLPFTGALGVLGYGALFATQPPGKESPMAQKDGDQDGSSPTPAQVGTEIPSVSSPVEDYFKTATPGQTMEKAAKNATPLLGPDRLTELLKGSPKR